MNEKTERPKSTEGVPGAPATPTPLENNEQSYGWQIGGGLVLLAILIVLTLRILRRRPPQEQPLREGELPPARS